MIAAGDRIASPSITLSHYRGFVDPQRHRLGHHSLSSVHTVGTASLSKPQDAPASAPAETIVRFQPKSAKRALEPVAAQPAAEVSRNDAADGVIREIGGRKDGTDPTRYGDWEKNGRCIDF